MRLTRVVRAAAAVLAGSLLLAGCDFDVYELPLPGGTDVGDNPMTVKIEFQDVLCALISANDPNGQLCDRIRGLPLPRAAALLGAGSGSAFGESDPSLGGLVGVSE